DAYAARLLARFGNERLEHRLAQIAMDGSQKLPQRWLEGAAARLARGEPIDATADGAAAWMHYVRRMDGAGRRHAVDDPLARVRAGAHRRSRSAAEVVARLLAVREVFPEPLAADDRFRGAVLDAYRRLAAESGH